MGNKSLHLLIATLIAASALYLIVGLRAPVDYILPLRMGKLAALIVVGAAIGAATVMFQTVSANRLLTPGIVGFDALFVFLQTALVLTLGGAGYAGIPATLQFGIEALCLMLAGLVLFGVLLRKGAGDMLRMILTGVILGVFLRGLSGFAARLLDPSEFTIIQDVSVASFGAVDPLQLTIAGSVLIVALLAAHQLGPRLDVATLGRDRARSIGLDYDRTVLQALAVISLLVALSTALVGPVTFLGLLAASLAHAVARDFRHRVVIPASALIGAIILVTGQFVFERLLGLNSTLAVVIEFAGGLLFLFLVLRKRKP